MERWTFRIVAMQRLGELDGSMDRWIARLDTRWMGWTIARKESWKDWMVGMDFWKNGMEGLGRVDGWIRLRFGRWM